MEEVVLKYLPIFRENLLEAVSYIRETLQNPIAANNFVDDVEEAILTRSKNPESFEQYNSLKERKYPYYRIYVKNFVIYYAVIPSKPKIMEIRRFLSIQRNREFIV